MADVKFGQRLVRAFVYGTGAGFILYILGYAAAHALSGLPANMGTLGFIIGFGGATGIELSKDMANKQ